MCSSKPIIDETELPKLWSSSKKLKRFKVFSLVFQNVGNNGTVTSKAWREQQQQKRVVAKI